jgi:hypothetical protein
MCCDTERVLGIQYPRHGGSVEVKDRNLSVCAADVPTVQSI